MVKMLHSIDSFGILKVSMSNIRIEKLEDRIKPKVSFPHRHDFFQIMFVTAGSGWHLIDFKKHKVMPHQVFLMKPGQMHSWELSKGVKGYILEFNHQSLNTSKENTKLMNQFSFSPDVQLYKNKKEFQQLITVCEVMIDEFNARQDMYDLCLQGYLTSQLIQLMRSYQHQVKQQKTLSVIEKLKDLIENNFKTTHSVEFYSHQLNLSPKTLTMQLHRSIGKPPKQLIQERILLEAKRYLAFSDLSIAEIGYELGFEDANYFTRFFRLHEKMSPAKFRKDALKR